MSRATFTDAVAAEQWERQAESAYATWGAAPLSSWQEQPKRTKSAVSRRKGTHELMIEKSVLPGRALHPVTGLHKAAFTGDHGAIMRIGRSEGPRAPLDLLDRNGCTPLMYAVMGDSKDGIEVLMNFSAKKEVCDNEKRTAVHYAAFFGHHRSLQFLIDFACDWTPRDSLGRVPLHWAVVPPSTKCLSILLKHIQIVFGELTPRDQEGMTPVHCAAQYCRPRHLEVMEQADCDFTLVDCEGRTALHWTADNPDDSAVLAILNAYPPLLNRQDVYGSTPLHLAASKGSLHVVRTLLKQNEIEVDPVDTGGRSPVHWACISGSGDVVRLLLKDGSLESRTDKEGFTPLHYAVQYEQYDAVCVLAALPSPTHTVDQNGRTPLMWAAGAGSPVIMQELLGNGSIKKDINKTDNEGKTALHFACDIGSVECVNALLIAGASPNLQDTGGQHPLFSATLGGHAQCIEALLSYGCDPDHTDANGSTAAHQVVGYAARLHSTVEEGEWQVGVAHIAQGIAALGKGGASLDVMDPSGNAPIHLAILAGLVELSRALLSALANPNVQDANGYTPLHLAVVGDREDLVALLLTHHAHPSLSDSSANRYTALDLAMLHSRPKCAELLSAVGALSKETIRDFAATCIQAAYKGHRARLLYRRELQRHKSVTVISSHWRGVVQRRCYLIAVQRQRAAIKVQSIFRGYLQRKRYRGVLTARLKAREQKKHIKQFTTNFEESYAVRRISLPASTVSAWRKESSEQDREEERKKRLELALQLREMQQAQQKEWERFRREEGQRRVDKANRLKAEQLAKILAQSQERRRHIDECSSYTSSLRTQTRAATTIQRAYRRWRQETASRRRLLEKLRLRKRAREDAAARRIQIAWRSYLRHHAFLARYYRIIPTAPTVVPQRSWPIGCSSTVKRSVSFMEGTLTTGQPRHKLNLTLQSNIKVVSRPATSIVQPTRRQLGQAKSPQDKPSTGASPRRLVHSEREKHRPWYEALMSTKGTTSAEHVAVRSPCNSPWSHTADPTPALPSIKQKTTRRRTLTLPDTFHFPTIISKS